MGKSVLTLGRLFLALPDISLSIACAVAVTHRFLNAVNYGFAQIKTHGSKSQGQESTVQS